MSKQTHFYLRGFRKRANLTQQDLAHLLGFARAVSVSKYETHHRGYSLDTALRLQVIFRVPVAELFSDRYTKVELEVTNRARELQSAIDRADQRQSHKQAFLRDLIAGREPRAPAATWRKQKTMPRSLR